MNEVPMDDEGDQGSEVGKVELKTVEVPKDFPADPFPASLSGAQFKVAVREIDGQYVIGLTREERVGRYLVCEDMVKQVMAFTEKKHRQRPDLTMEGLLDQIDAGIRLKGWELGAREFDWIMGRVRRQFLAVPSQFMR
ncbi:MAG: hypothetical protein ACREBU_17800 [Nitrososphaera sp.]